MPVKTGCQCHFLQKLSLSLLCLSRAPILMSKHLLSFNYPFTYCLPCQTGSSKQHLVYSKFSMNSFRWTDGWMDGGLNKWTNRIGEMVWGFRSNLKQMTKPGFKPSSPLTSSIIASGFLIPSEPQSCLLWHGFLSVPLSGVSWDLNMTILVKVLWKLPNVHVFTS